LKDVSLATRAKVEASEARCDRPLWNHAKNLLNQRLAGMPPEDVLDFAKFKVSARQDQY
jgi:hypothetical protein